jgi:hypothetical protein
VLAAGGEMSRMELTHLCALPYDSCFCQFKIGRPGQFSADDSLLPPELIWAIRRHLAESFLRFSAARAHEMASI